MINSVYLEFISHESFKFYEITVSETTVTIIFGRISYNGVKKLKIFKNSESACKFYEAQIKKKIKKGYKIAEKKQSFRIKPSHPDQLLLPFI